MRRLRINPSLAIGLALLTGLLLFTALPWLVQLPDPDEVHMTKEIAGETLRAPFRPGEAGYILGSDMGGRDLLSRLAHGARYTLLIGGAVVLARAVVAVPLGLLLAWTGGALAGLSRMFGAMFTAIPMLVMIVFLLSSVRQMVPGLYWPYLVVGVLTLVGLPRMVEQVRTLAMNTLEAPFVEAAIAVGAHPVRIMFKHVFRVIRGDIVVVLAADVAWALILLAHLAIFDVYLEGTTLLGWVYNKPVLGEILPEWSQMLGHNKDVVRLHPWVPLLPALTLGLTVACFHFLAEGLRLRWLRRV